MRLLTRLLAATALMVIGLAAPAHADGRVDVNNQDGDAVVDPTYLTTLNLSGSGFQSIKGGHGGIYVFFGTVQSGWRPSQGGQTGADYFYVPDGESRDNQGYAKFVAYPGSDTAGSANGGTISASGGWSTTIKVPGATFQAFDRDGVGTRQVRRVRGSCAGRHGEHREDQRSPPAQHVAPPPSAPSSVRTALPIVVRAPACSGRVMSRFSANVQLALPRWTHPTHQPTRGDVVKT